MGLIKQHLDRELSKLNPDLHILNELTKIFERGNIERGEWRQSGRFINRDDFMAERPEENLHVDCTDVVRYYGDVYLQLLKNGFYLVEPDFKHSQIKISEDELFKKHIEQFFP